MIELATHGPRRRSPDLCAGVRQVARGRAITLRVFLAGLLAAGCGQDDRALPAVVDSAGVTIVTGPSNDSLLQGVSFREVARLTTLGDDVPLAGIAPFSIGVDAQDNIRVLLRQDRQVAVFDSSLVLRFRVGQRGSGPGELSMPFYFAVADDGRMAVHDFGRNAIIEFAPDGQLRAEHQLSGQMIAGLAVNGDSILTGTQVNYALPSEQGMDVVIAHGPDTTRLAGVTVPPAPSVTFPTCKLTLAYPPQFTKSLIWAARNGTIAMSREIGYVVDIWQQDRRMSLRRPIAPRAGTASLAEALLGPGLSFAPNGVPCLVPASEVVSVAGFAASIPIVRAIRIDRAGRIWVERWTAPDEDEVIDLFSSSGQYLGTMVGQPMPVAFLSGDRAVYLEGSARDGQAIVVKEVELP